MLFNHPSVCRARSCGVIVMATADSSGDSMKYLKTLSKYEFDEASIVLMEGGLVMIHEGRLVGINFDLVVLGCFTWWMREQFEQFVGVPFSELSIGFGIRC